MSTAFSAAPGGEIAEVAVPAQVAEHGCDRAAVLVKLDDAGIDVGGPGYRRGVAQVGRHLADDPDDGSLAGRFTGGGLGHSQAHSGQHGRMPGAEVLGRVIASRDLPQIVVDVGRGDVVPALAASVGQQPVPATAAPSTLSLVRPGVPR